MSINLGTYALVSALAIGGVVAQQQYSKPAGPPENGNAPTEQSVQPNQSDNAGTPLGSTAAAPDCNTLMLHHQQMTAEIDKLDDQAATLVSQMKDAKSDRAKLEATMGVVEALVTHRKQIRDRMSAVQHETLQFLFAHKASDLNTACPQMTEWLQKGMMNEQNTEQGGPNDMELGNER